MRIVHPKYEGPIRVIKDGKETTCSGYVEKIEDTFDSQEDRRIYKQFSRIGWEGVIVGVRGFPGDELEIVHPVHVKILLRNHIVTAEKPSSWAFVSNGAPLSDTADEPITVER